MSSFSSLQLRPQQRLHGQSVFTHIQPEAPQREHRRGENDGSLCNVNTLSTAAAPLCSFPLGGGVTQFIRLIKSSRVPIASRDEQSRTVQGRALETGN